MTNKQLLMLAAVINVLMMFMLAYKQNMIIKYLYELQQLQEQRNELLEEKKELTLNLHKLTQLSTIEAQAKNQLHLQSMTLKDINLLQDKEHKAKAVHAITTE